MKLMTWLAVLATLGVLGYVVWIWRQRWLEHKRTSEERLAGFIAQARPAAAPIASAPIVEKSRSVEGPSTVPLQKLLFDAAMKAGEAGEAALSIQLYARLLVRYPESTLGTQARAAVEAQKKKLAKP